MINTSEAFQTSIVGKSRRIYIRAVIDISDPDKVYLTPTASSTAPWAKPEQLHDRNIEAPVRYATLEPGRWLLDGSFGLIPDDNNITGNVGYVLNELAGDDGTFETEQWVEQGFENISILQAFSLFFSTDHVDGVPEDFKVEVLCNGQAIYTKEITGNSETQLQFDGFTVYDPTAIRITVTKWSLPGRRVRVMDILPGIFEEWSSNMLASFSVTQQGDFSCLTLPYGTVHLSVNNQSKRFEPRNKSGIFQSIEERQGIELYIGVRLPDKTVEYVNLGVFYQSGDGWKEGDNKLSIGWDLVDIVGLVAERTFIVPDTLPTTLDGWIAAVVSQLGSNFASRYHVDPDYADLSVTANSADDVTGKKCGDILRWVCMATGTWPRADAETGDLTAEPLWNQGNKLLLRALVDYPIMRANESVAALIFHLADGSNTEYVVSGTSTSSGKTVTIENPFIHTTDQAITASKMILSCYGGNVIETTGRGNPTSEIGDVDTIWLNESVATTARRMVQTFQMQDGVLQGCGSKLLQADGSFLWENREVFTENGVFHTGPNTTQLRLILSQGGQGSSPGQDGFVGGSGVLPGSGVSAGTGEQGLNGSGGKVWTGVVNVNPDTDYAIVIGKGGAKSAKYGVPGTEGGETTFGVYSSENGKVYDTGYSDIANGDSFGRTGVPSPLDGTGDGAQGGKGGEAGAGYWEDDWWPDGRHKGWKFIITALPGPGQPGKDGADGVCVIYWDKE